jgi:hypothetical protein
MAKNQELELEAQNEAQLEQFIANVDTEKVESIKKDLESYKDHRLSVRKKYFKLNFSIYIRYNTMTHSHFNKL